MYVSSVSVQYDSDIPRCVLQMRETIMNQEKLAKLQAQVRIGGKVRVKVACFRCFLWVNVIHNTSLACYFYIDGMFSIGHCPQKEEGGSQNSNCRWQKASVLTEKVRCKQHLWYWGGNVSLNALFLCALNSACFKLALNISHCCVAGEHVHKPGHSDPLQQSQSASLIGSQHLHHHRPRRDQTADGNAALYS